MKYLAFIAAVFGGDQFAKKQIEQKLKFHEEKKVCGNWLILTKHHNNGAACNCYHGKKELLIAISSAVLGSVCTLLVLSGKNKGKAYLKLAYSLILGGGLSNLYDRLTMGYVVDYFRFEKAPKPIKTIIFNLGDLAIFLGSAFAIVGEVMTGSEHEDSSLIH